MTNPEFPCAQPGDELPPLANRTAAALREIAKPLAKGSKSILERAADMLEAQTQATGTEPPPVPCECADRGHCDGSCAPYNQPSDDLPNIVKTAPQAIYLIIDPDLSQGADFTEVMRSFEDSVEWCSEDSYDNGIKYVRADRALNAPAPEPDASIRFDNIDDSLLDMLARQHVEALNVVRNGGDEGGKAALRVTTQALIKHAASLVPCPAVGVDDARDAARWRTFIGLDYAIRAEWAANLSLAPVLTQWVDGAAAEPDHDASRCDRCHGEGWHWVEREGVDWRDKVHSKEHCEQCDGIGWCGPDAQAAATHAKEKTNA